MLTVGQLYFYSVCMVINVWSTGCWLWVNSKHIIPDDYRYHSPVGRWNCTSMSDHMKHSLAVIQEPQDLTGGSGCMMFYMGVRLHAERQCERSWAYLSLCRDSHWRWGYQNTLRAYFNTLKDWTKWLTYCTIRHFQMHFLELNIFNL